jgi:non-ribosomal peptide synthetase-like protein
LFFAFLPFLAVLPAALLLLWAWERHSVAGLVGYSFLAGPVFVTTLCTLAVLLKRALVGSVPSGTHPLRSAVGLRKWLGDHFVFTCLTSVNSLFATLYTPLLLRGLGARIGRRSEVSTVAHIDSDCLVLDDECFIADLAALGPARQCNGQVSVARTYIGKRSFVGNAALVSNDTHVGARSLIGVLSTPPAGHPVEPETDWLGSPAIFLPRRQPSGDFPEQLTFRPRPAQVAGRLFIEFWRATLPSTLFILLATGIISGAFFLAPRMGRLALLWAVPGMALMGALVLLLIVIALKWIVVGRYRPRVAPLWALFVRRSEFITGMYESAAVPAMVGWLTGTPLVGPVLRLFGVHIGRGTYLDTTFITEFDLLSIGDHTSIGMRASLQTHLFEDRVMKMSTVDVGPGCTVGSRAVILYDAHIEAGARLAPLSLVMKGETLPSHTSWRGVPVQAER